MAAGALAGCATLGLGLGAAELVVRDLRLGAGVLPSEIAYTITDDFGSRDGQDTFSESYQITLGGCSSFTLTGGSWGLIPGVEVAAGQGSFDPAGEYRCYSARLYLGLGKALGDGLHIEAGPFAGYGLATFSFDGGSELGPLTANGSVLEYGVRGGVYYAIANRLRIGLEGIYAWNEATLAGSAGGMDVDLDLTDRGIAILLSISYRFASLPWSLE